MNTCVKVRLFARFRDAIGKDVIDVSLLDGTTVKVLRGQLALLHPEMATLLVRSHVAVNDELAADDVVIGPRDEIAILPPVSGG